jgi:uncharacterized membrane protein
MASPAVSGWTRRRGAAQGVRQIPGGVRGMHSIFYIIGVVVVVLVILSFLGFG